MANNPHTLSSDSLRKLLLEVSHIINSRPLTPVNATHWEDVAISPNMLLTGKSEVILKPLDPSNDSRWSNKMWKQSERLANQFWKKWRSEFLAELNSRQKWVRPQRNLMIGDVVLVKDKNTARCMLIETCLT